MTVKNVTTTSRIDHPVNLYYQKKMLDTLDPLLIYAMFGQSVAMPQHEGDTVKWRRYAKKSAATTPLTEAEDPTPVQSSKTDISAQVREYGSYEQISSWLKFTGLGSDQDAIVDRLKAQMALTIDTLCRDVVIGGASGATCSNGSPVTSYLNKTDVDTAVRTLLTEDASMITPKLKAGTGQGTSPIRDSFIALASNSLITDIENISGFKHVANYAQPGDAYPGEWGATGNVRWILSSNGYKSGSDYTVSILAKDAYGNVQISGGQGPLIYTPADRTGSPLQRYSTVGWLRNYVARILNEVLVYNLVCTSVNG